MNDLIYREREYLAEIGQTEPSGIERILGDAIALLKEQEPVVRCKDCKECYFASNRVPTEQSYVCGKHGRDVSLEWFCADGEREEGR